MQKCLVLIKVYVLGESSFKTEVLDLHILMGSFASSFPFGVYIYHHCTLGLHSAGLVKDCSWNNHCALLVTPPVGIDEESRNWHAGDSPIGLWLGPSFQCVMGDSTPCHQGKSSPGSACW